MTYFDFFKLSFLQFKRSPNFSKKTALKILRIVGYLLFGLYMLALVFLMYQTIKEKFPQEDIFIKSNQYIFGYFFIVLYTMMYLNFDSMQVKSFMLLPVKKSKIVKFQLLKVLVHPVNWVFILMIGAFVVLMYLNNYNLPGLLFWAIAVLTSTFVIEFLMFFSSRHAIFNVFMSFMFFLIIIKMKWLAVHLGFIGTFYSGVYRHSYYAIFPIGLLLLTIIFLYQYILKRFYLDDAIKGQKTSKINHLDLKWTEKYGLIGKLVQNDIRLIWRNARPKQGVTGFVVFYIMAFFLLSKYGTEFKQPEFNKILFLMMLSGYFVAQFGNFVPAWDSEYYPLLMTQGINYRDYLEAKWWLMAVSVVIILIIGLPFLLLGWQVYILFLAMAVFNLGFNIPMTLFTGAYRTSPIKLNEKVKAFQNKDSFKLKTFLFSIIRLIVPIVIYLLLKKYFGYQYGVVFLFITGILGLILKNYLLDHISKIYKSRKYQTLEAFRKGEE